VELLIVEGNNVKTILCRGKRGAAATRSRENINTAIILRESNERTDVGFDKCSGKPEGKMDILKV